MIPDHPVIQYMERDGFLPRWYYCLDEEPEHFDEDSAYEERREAELYGN